MSSSNSPCAACKFLRRKCTPECVLAPYFPPDNPERFSCVHRVFGKSNVEKLLNELSAAQRDDAVKSLAYEAEARLRDPVYGCVGFISVLQQRLRQIQTELHSAKKELATYLTPQAMQAMQAMLANPNMIPPAGVVMPHQHQAGYLFSSAVVFPPYGKANNVAPPPTFVAAPHNLVIRDAQQQELLEAQQLAVAQQQQREVMLRSYEQQQQEFLRFNSGGFEPVGSVAVAGGGGGFNQMGAGAGPAELALGTFDNFTPYQIQQAHQGEHHHHHHHPHPHTHVPQSHHHPIEAQLFLSPQSEQQSQQQQQSEIEDGRSVGPSG